MKAVWKGFSDRSGTVALGIVMISLLFLSVMTYQSFLVKNQPYHQWGCSGIYDGQASAHFQLDVYELDLKSGVMRSSFFYVEFLTLDQSFNSVLLFLPPNETRTLTGYPPRFDNGTYDWTSLVRSAPWTLQTRPEKGAAPWSWYLKPEGHYPWDDYSLTFVFGFNRTMTMASATSYVWLPPALSDEWVISQSFDPLGSSPIDALRMLGFTDRDMSRQLCGYDCDGTGDVNKMMERSRYKDFYQMRISFMRQPLDILRGTLAFWVPAMLVLGLLILAFGKIDQLELDTAVALFVGIGLATLPLILGSLWLLPPRLSLVESLFYCEGALSIAFAGIVIATKTRRKEDRSCMGA